MLFYFSFNGFVFIFGLRIGFIYISHIKNIEEITIPILERPQIKSRTFWVLDGYTTDPATKVDTATIKKLRTNLR